KVDAQSRNVAQKAQGVQRITAPAAFVQVIKDKQSALETGWAKQAEAKGLKDPAKVLAEFRAEIAKVK
ncbi:MAG: hypothetical protein RL307_712, partial [Pseudomonadota bacterium]